MATIGEIMAAKDPNFKYKLNLPWGGEDDKQPETPTVATPDSRNDASAPPSAQGQPTGTGDEIDKLIAAQQDADRRADERISRREVGALMSQGARDPSKILTTDAEDMRKRPLEMYQARLAARKQAAESALQAAQGRHLDVESANIPIEQQRKQEKDIAEGKYQTGELAARGEEEAGRGKRSEAEIKSREGIAREEMANRAALSEPYAFPVNPMTGEVTPVNKRTGQTSASSFSEEMRPAIEHNQAKRQGLDKALDAAETSQDELEQARQAVKAHPESFNNSLATGAESAAGHVPIVGSMLAQRIGPYLRGEAGQAARLQALQAAAGRIHEIAGTRGFSASEQATMARLTPSQNDTAEQVMQKLQAAEEVAKRAQARIRGKLPVNIQHPEAQGGGIPPTVIGGKTFHVVNGQLMVEE